LSADLENLILGEKSIGSVRAENNVKNLNIVFKIVLGIININYHPVKRCVVIIIVVIGRIIEILIEVVPTLNKVSHTVAG
tara:strand:+ start:433 stop:672 length:240 start_codon:yes stop_codon:yes gene_type:complete